MEPGGQAGLSPVHPPASVYQVHVKRFGGSPLTCLPVQFTPLVPRRPGLTACRVIAVLYELPFDVSSRFFDCFLFPNESLFSKRLLKSIPFIFPLFPRFILRLPFAASLPTHPSIRQSINQSRPFHSVGGAHLPCQLADRVRARCRRSAGKKLAN